MKTISRILLFIVFYCGAHAAYADTNRRTPSEDGTFTAGPYYNSATKSYFELVRTESNTWQQASMTAASHRFKGISGRLATINRPETHLFIVRNFIFPERTWIGLRFFCEDSDLVWSDGQSHKAAKFSNWNAMTRLNGVDCTDRGYIATFINANAFDWSLNILDGRANLLLIEYPTGRQ